MEFYDVRVGAAIVSSHKTLQQASWSNKKRRATVVSCSPVWTELNGAIYRSIPRQSASRSFGTLMKTF